MIDYHLHLWRHTEVATSESMSVERFAEAARVRGIGEIAVTEHLLRFRQAADALGDFWADEPDASLRESMRAYVAHHATVDLDDYVDAVLSVRDAGVAVRVGLEVDYYPDKMDTVGALVSGYPFDVLLGSVHWLGAWRLDDVEDRESMRRWELGDVASIWRAYTDAVVDLARSRCCDVLAHLDLAKVAGFVPSESVLVECHARIADAVLESGVAVEVSSAGLRKPIGEMYPAPELLARLVGHAAAVTTASDAHEPETVGDGFEALEDVLSDLGVGSLRTFRARAPLEVPLRRTRRWGAARS